MIKVTYWKDKKLQNWYAGQVMGLIMENVKRAKSGPAPGMAVLHELAMHLQNMDEEVLRDILLKDRNSLVKKYNWIAEYVKLCDFVAYYNELVEETKKTKTYTSLRRQYLNDFKGYYLEKFLLKLAIDEDELVRSWDNFNKLKKEAAICCRNASQFISHILDYKMLSAQVRQELYQKMDIDVCPYCNRQYIHTISITTSGTYLGDLDHFYPQSCYQLFSLSLWNLIPVCKPCNQLLKRFFNKHILSPFEGGFDDDCIFRAIPKDTAAYFGLNDHLTLKWEIQSHTMPEKRKKIQQNLDMFRLDDVYQFQVENVKSILFSRYLHSRAYFDKVDGILAKLSLPEEEINRLRYRTSLDKEQFHKELLGKMTYDIVKHY